MPCLESTTTHTLPHSRSPRLAEDNIRTRVGRKNMAIVRPRFALAVDVSESSAGYIKIEQLVALLHDGEGGAASYILNRGCVGVSEDHIWSAFGGEYLKVAWIHFRSPIGRGDAVVPLKEGVGEGVSGRTPADTTVRQPYFVGPSPGTPPAESVFCDVTKFLGYVHIQLGW